MFFHNLFVKWYNQKYWISGWLIIIHPEALTVLGSDSIMLQSLTVRKLYLVLLYKQTNNNQLVTWSASLRVPGDLHQRETHLLHHHTPGHSLDNSCCVEDTQCCTDIGDWGHTQTWKRLSFNMCSLTFLYKSIVYIISLKVHSFLDPKDL